MILFCSTKPKEQLEMLIEVIKRYDDAIDYDSSDDYVTLANTIKTTSFYKAIVIDIDSYSLSPEQLYSSTLSLVTLSTSNIILLAFGGADSEVVGKLSSITSRIITAMQEQQITRELEIHLQGGIVTPMGGATTADTLQGTKSQKRIGVMGICSRIGVTTVALQLSRHLANMGKSVIYVQSNGSNHLALIAEANTSLVQNTDSSVFEQGNLHFVSNESYLSQSTLSRYSYIVYDYGVGGLDEYLSCECKVLVCGSKEWEIDKLPDFLVQLYHDKTVHYIFNYTSIDDERVKSSILELMDYADTRTHFLDYTPNYLDGVSEHNGGIFNAVLNVTAPAPAVVEKDESGKVGEVKKRKKFFGLL